MLLPSFNRATSAALVWGTLALLPTPASAQTVDINHYGATVKTVCAQLNLEIPRVLNFMFMERMTDARADPPDGDPRAREAANRLDKKSEMIEERWARLNCALILYGGK
jgi:hypothetical protein